MAKVLGLSLVLIFVVSMVTVGTCARCLDDVMEMALYCQNYLMHPAEPKIPPSEKCCDAVEKIDIPCLCSWEYEQGVCMEKLVYVADYCGKPLKPGCKCGSYTVPPLGQQEDNC